EYQVPIPTSSSPARKPSSSRDISSPSTPYSRPPQIPTPHFSQDFIHDRIRRRARSRSASRERRMSIVPTPWQGLPSTPGRRGTSSGGSNTTLGHEFSQHQGGEQSEGSGSEEESLSTRSTETREEGIQQQQQQQRVEVKQVVYNMESMTPLRNWATQLAEGPSQFDKSPPKMKQLQIQNQLPRLSHQHKENSPANEPQDDQ